MIAFAKTAKRNLYLHLLPCRRAFIRSGNRHNIGAASENQGKPQT